MTSYHITISEPAENDLNAIADYIAIELRNPPAAKHLISKIANAVFSLEQMPKRNTFVNSDRLAAKGIRKLIVENYIVFYIVSDTNHSVTIIIILYKRRNWNDLL